MTRCPPYRWGTISTSWPRARDRDRDRARARAYDDKVSPIQVGHNIYILAYKLSEHKRELKDALDHAGNEDSIRFYAKHTAQIEVGTLIKQQVSN